MAHHKVRLAQFKDFNPETNKWRNDKDRATGSFQVLVAKNYSTLGIPCVAIYPDIDKGKFVGINVAAPEGPLKDYFDQDDTKKMFFELLQDAFFYALAKKEKLRNGVDVKASSSESKLVGFAEPPMPIWMLTLKELETYFSALKTHLAATDKVIIRRKWPKIENGKAVKLPTKIPLLDDVVDQILPSHLFVPGQKFAPGNLQWRLKLVCAYIMLKNNHDPNTFATEIPEDYQPKAFSLNDLKEFSKNVEISAEEHHRKKKIPAEIEHHVPFYLQEDNNIDYDASNSESEGDDVLNNKRQEENHSQYSASFVLESSPANSVSGTRLNSPRGSNLVASRLPCSPPPESSTKKPTGSTSGLSRSSMPATSRTKPFTPSNTKQKQVLFDGLVSIPLPNDVFYDIDEFGLNTSHLTGTPTNSDKGEETDEEAVMARMEEEDNDIDDFKKLMESSDIKKILSGQDCESLVLQIYNFERLSRAKSYRAHGQDGRLASTKISFSANINNKVEELYGKLPILRITSYQLYNGSFLFIKDFDVLSILDTLVGSPEYLTVKDYEQMKTLSNANTNLPQTPSMVNKKLTNKHVEQLNVVPRSSSQRVKNRSVGGS